MPARRLAQHLLDSINRAKGLGKPFVYLALAFIHGTLSAVRQPGPQRPQPTPTRFVMANYIPAKDADFSNWLLNFSTLLTAAPTDYGLIAGDATLVAAQNTAFQAAFTAATNPATRTAVTIAAKDTARVNAEAVVRPYATQISRNPAVDPGDKTAIGVTVPDPSRSPIPAPATAPVLSIRSMIPGQVRYDYRDATDPTGRLKPFGVVALQLFASFGTVASVDPDQLSFVTQATKTPSTISTAGNAGKVMSIAGRWVTRSGPSGIAQVGPWSAIVSSVVP
jgi:hypothetical protein